MSEKDSFSFSRMHRLLEEKKKKDVSKTPPLTPEKESSRGKAAKSPVFSNSKFPTGEKRTTLRISIETADKARELENKIYWLTKKRLSLAQQARIALNAFLELPLELDDINEDDDLEYVITQKALSLVEKINDL